MIETFVADFLDLFKGRLDTAGLDMTASGAPGPFRFHESTDYAESWIGLANGHLCGRLGIGVYPVWHGQVEWGCVDFDDGEDAAWEHATALRSVLNAFNITGWIERSRSKGYHVWVFSAGWVPALMMRRALMGACAISGVPDREVNPKSASLDPDQLGNFVRLPYFASDAAMPTHQAQREARVAGDEG